MEQNHIFMEKLKLLNASKVTHLFEKHYLLQAMEEFWSLMGEGVKGAQSWETCLLLLLGIMDGAVF